MSALVDAVRVALGEMYEPAVLDDVCEYAEVEGVLRWPGLANMVKSDDARKASRLARLHLYGPMFPAVCDSHYKLHIDAWGRCARVPVREALMGHVCGQP